MFHVEGQRRPGNVPCARARGEVSGCERGSAFCRLTRTNGRSSKRFWTRGAVLHRGADLTRRAELAAPTGRSSVRQKEESPPPPSAAGTVVSTPAMSSARTRPPVSSMGTKRDSYPARGYGQGPTWSRDARKFVSPPRLPLYPSAGRNRASTFSLANFPLAYLGELALRLLLLRGIDRRPQQLRELTRVHRSGPPQLAWIN